jgi:putative ABC transport system substrate-binding protein
VATTVPAPGSFVGPALAGTAAAGGAVPRVAVLMSQDAEPYQAALDGFRHALEQQGSRAVLDVYALHGDDATAEAALQKAKQDGAQLLFTLGSLATQTAVRQGGGTPIVAGMILSAGDVAGAGNATCVVLEFPVETEFRWLQKLLPGQRNIGVLFNPENQERVTAAERAARNAGLTLFPRKISSPKEIPDALDGLARRVDVLWGVPDQVVLTPETVKPILLFSLRNRIPFVGLSSTWVKAGALYALERDYADIGAQCAELALKIMQGTPPSALPPVAPRKVLYAVNMKTAKIMKLDFERAVIAAAKAVVE